VIVWILETVGPAVKDFLTTSRDVCRLKTQGKILL
jgi:hypothetical protein